MDIRLKKSRNVVGLRGEADNPRDISKVREWNTRMWKKRWTRKLP